MTPAARVQAAIEILDEVIASVRADGPPADSIVTHYFKQRRYAGSKDRRAVRELVFRAIRRTAERPETGRAAILGLAEEEPELLELFGEPRGPEPRMAEEQAAPAALVPEWIKPELSPLVTEAEWPALLERAPLDLRVNAARVSRDEILPQIDGAPTPLSPWGIRLPPGSRIDDHEAYRSGLVEVQDEGSQLIALACEPQNGEACSTSAPAPAANRSRLPPRRLRRGSLQPTPTARGFRSCCRERNRAGARIETRLLNPPNELTNSPTGGQGRPRSCRCALLGKRHLAAQSGGPLAPHARAAGPPDRSPTAAARYRCRAGAPRRPARLCGLLASVPRRGRAD